MTFFATANVAFGATGYEYVNAEMDGTIIAGPIVPLTYSAAVTAVVQQLLMSMGVGS